MIPLRPYRADDFPALAALMDAAAPGWTMTHAGLRSLLTVPGYQPETDLFVALASGGGLVGARDVRITARGDEAVLILESWGCVHPAADTRVLTGTLLQAAFGRARDLVAEHGRARGLFQARCGEDDGEIRAAFAAFELRFARRLVTMVRHDLDGIEEPRFPAKIALRPYRPGEDDVRWVAAFNAAFADHWGGFMGMSLERWHHDLQDGVFKPEISLVAWDGWEVAGFCHCRIDDNLNALNGQRLGMIRYVGVRPPWRGQGLGTALTRAGLMALRNAGMDAVALGVDAENVTGAHRLYARLGFEIVDRQVLYRRPVFATPVGGGAAPHTEDGGQS